MINKFIPKKDEIDSIENVINYMILDEEKHWEEANKPKKNHIYLDLLNLQNYINRVKKQLKK